MGFRIPMPLPVAIVSAVSVERTGRCHLFDDHDIAWSTEGDARSSPMRSPMWRSCPSSVERPALLDTIICREWVRLSEMLLWLMSVPKSCSCEGSWWLVANYRYNRIRRFLLKQAGKVAQSYEAVILSHTTELFMDADIFFTVEASGSVNFRIPTRVMWAVRIPLSLSSPSMATE